MSIVPAIFAIPRQIGQDDSIKRWNNPSHRLQKQGGKFSVLIFEMEIKKVSVTRQESRADKQKFAKTKGIN